MKYCTDDGKHIFDSIEKYEAYQKQLDEKEKQEEIRLKKISKLEASIDKSLDELNKLSEEYTNLTDRKLYFTCSGGKLEKCKVVYNPISLLDEIFYRG